MTFFSPSFSPLSAKSVILSKKNEYKNLNKKTSGISIWFERWFLSSNAKDICAFYTPVGTAISSKPHAFSSMPLQSGIFTMNRNFLIGFVSSIITVHSATE
jgi:hypothetical protein